VTKLVKSNELFLDIEAKSGFVSVRANTAVFKDLFYYEVTLMGDGLAQIGWCQLQTTFDPHNGVGDDKNSFAYDGNRIKKWNGGSEVYGE
jgi:Kip1 ubiquitination-promoting complex protein 1